MAVAREPVEYVRWRALALSQPSRTARLESLASCRSSCESRLQQSARRTLSSGSEIKTAAADPGMAVWALLSRSRRCEGLVVLSASELRTRATVSSASAREPSPVSRHDLHIGLGSGDRHPERAAREGCQRYGDCELPAHRNAESRTRRARTAALVWRFQATPWRTLASGSLASHSKSRGPSTTKRRPERTDPILPLEPGVLDGGQSRC